MSLDLSIVLTFGLACLMDQKSDRWIIKEQSTANNVISIPSYEKAPTNLS